MDIRKILIGILIIPVMILTSPAFSTGARIKDIADIEGVRYNQLIGYGLVVGLNGTGDKKGTEFTVHSIASMLTKMGITVDPALINVKNVAAVMVTAKLPPFAKKGTRLDVLVSSIGDATSLQGGTLLLTPLMGPDRVVYAVAQGPISVGGYMGGEGGDNVQKNHTTVGRISGGAIVEREIKMNFNNQNKIAITLHDEDFTTAVRMARVINDFYSKNIAFPEDARTVTISVPPEYTNRVVELVANIENLEIQVDTPARVVINERTGTIVMGENVQISTVAVAHGNLTVQIKTQLEVSQPEAFSRGKTVVVPQKEVNVEEQKGRLILLKKSVTVEEVVRALNSVGVTPRDLIAILQAIKAAGALQAELEII